MKRNIKAVFCMFTLVLCSLVHAGEERLSSFTDLADALSTIGSSATTLVFDANVSLTSNTTVPNNIHAQVLQGTTIATQGYTLTFEGGFEAGAFTIFDVSGGSSIIFDTPEVAFLHPEWWGIDGTADQVQIDRAMSASASQPIPVKLSATTYHFDNTLYLDAGTILSADGTTISSTVAGPAIRMNTDVQLRGSYLIDGNDVVGSIGLGYHSLPIYYSQVERIEINNCFKAVLFSTNGANGIYFNTIDHLVAVNNTFGVELKTTHTHGVAAVNANHFNFASINNNARSGLIVENSHGTSFDYLEVERNGIQWFDFDSQDNMVFENDKYWGIKLVDVDGFFVNAGWIEKNGALRERATGDFHETDETNVKIDYIDGNDVVHRSQGVAITAHITDLPVSVYQIHSPSRTIRLQSQNKFQSFGQETFESIKVNRRSPVLGTSDLAEQQVMRSARLQVSGDGAGNAQIQLQNRFNSQDLPSLSLANSGSSDYYHLSSNGYDLRLDRYAFCDMVGGSCDPDTKNETLIVGHLNGSVAQNNTGTAYTVELETGVGIYFRLFDLNGNPVAWTSLGSSDSLAIDFSFISGESVMSP